MGTTTDRGEAGLLRVAATAFDAALGQAEWDEPLRGISRLVGANIVALVEFGWADEALTVSFNLPDELARDYQQHYWSQDVWRIGAMKHRWPSGKVAVTDSFIDEREFLNSEFYNDHLRVGDIRYWCGGPLDWDGSAGAAIGVMRPPASGQFDTDDIDAVEIAMSYVGRALEIKARLAALRHKWSSLVSGLDERGDGVLVLDLKTRLLEANRAADTALASGALYFDGLGLRARDARADQDMRAEIRRSLEPSVADSPRPILVPRGTDRPPLTIRVLPVGQRGALSLLSRSALIVLIEDPLERKLTPVQRATVRYRLTRAEARLLGHLIDGHSLKEASEVFGVSLHTVRNQLKQIFSKTETARQAQLVSLVLHMTGSHDPR